MSSISPASGEQSPEAIPPKESEIDMSIKQLCMTFIVMILLGGCTISPPQNTDTSAMLEPTLELPSSYTEASTPKFTTYWDDCEHLTPNNGVLILNSAETLEDVKIEGDVYITANGVINFKNVWVLGSVYCHGKLTLSGNCTIYKMYTYCINRSQDQILCSAFDGVHGILSIASGSYGYSYLTIHNAVLDNAFKKWGKYEPTEQTDSAPSQPSGSISSAPHTDPKDVEILSGKQTLMSKSFKGDVYITSTGDITFIDVDIEGDLYVYGKLTFSGTSMLGNGDSNMSSVSGCIYAYDFIKTCDAYNGIHGQITGGPVNCKSYRVANDALDYAFQTWGKQ